MSAEVLEKLKLKEGTGRVMKEFTYVITDEQGVHARPAGMLVKFAKELQSSVTITKDGKSADATRLMAVMGLGIKKGQEITVRVEGDNEEAEEAAIAGFFRENL